MEGLCAGQKTVHADVKLGACDELPLDLVFQCLQYDIDHLTGHTRLHKKSAILLKHHLHEADTG